MIRLGIIGGGIVGQAQARAFMEYAEVRVHDVIPEKATHDLASVLECDLIFLCLPTPQKDGKLECDTSALDQFFADRYLAKQTNRNYVIRSTVPVGFTAKMRSRYALPNVVHSPEFLTARCAMVDAQIPSRNIIGGEACHCHMMLKSLYTARFPGAQVLCMSSGESEAVKLFQNSFFAVKLSFFNEIFHYAHRLGLDWDKILAGMLSDGRIVQSHTSVPGPDGKYGWGGTCLPKDIASLYSLMLDIGLEPEVCMAAMARNALDRERPS